MLSKPIGKLHRTDEKTVEDCEIILDSYSLLAKDAFEDTNETKANNKDWAHGRKHIFLSEGIVTKGFKKKIMHFIHQIFIPFLKKYFQVLANN